MVSQISRESILRVGVRQITFLPVVSPELRLFPLKTWISVSECPQLIENDTEFAKPSAQNFRPIHGM
jgi:hypothetical protein